MSRTISTLAWPFPVRAPMLRILVFCIADHGGDLLQHPETVVTENGQFHWICGWRIFVFAPLDVDLAAQVRTSDSSHSDN